MIALRLPLGFLLCEVGVVSPDEVSIVMASSFHRVHIRIHEVVVRP
jgi:hypothetical protein